MVLHISKIVILGKQTQFTSFLILLSLHAHTKAFYLNYFVKDQKEKKIHL